MKKYLKHPFVNIIINSSIAAALFIFSMQRGQDNLTLRLSTLERKVIKIQNEYLKNQDTINKEFKGLAVDMAVLKVRIQLALERMK